MYSQNNEEEIILNYFGERTGTFIEVGAFHPIQLSNTRALVERGWSGIYVEPSKRHFEGFVNEYRGNKNIVLINAVLATHGERKKKFFACNDAVGTTEVSHRDKWQSVTEFEETEVDAIFIDELYDNPAPSFLSLDTEGTSYYLLTHFPKEWLSKVELICVEHDNKQEDIHKMLSYIGFQKLSENAENVIYGK